MAEQPEDTVGNVYVYNLFPETMTLILNGQGSAGKIAPPLVAEPYTPASLAVARGAAGSAPILQLPIFQQGANAITVNVIEQNWGGNLFIDSTKAPALVDDMVLYIGLVADASASGGQDALLLLFTPQGQLIALEGPGGTGVLKPTSGVASTDKGNNPPLGGGGAPGFK